MISKIISREACLTELASNSKSFSNCPDLHGGVPGLPGDRIRMKPALGKKKSSRWQLECLGPKIRMSKAKAAAIHRLCWFSIVLPYAQTQRGTSVQPDALI